MTNDRFLVIFIIMNEGILNKIASGHYFSIMVVSLSLRLLPC